MKFILLLLCVSSIAFAGPKTKKIPDGIFPALEGGFIAPVDEWKQVVWIGNCTATVVGQRVLATASHCIGNGATVRFTFLSNRYAARCTQNPQYRDQTFPGYTADHAYCVVDRVVEGLEYEVLNTDPAFIASGDMATLCGYGCKEWGGPIDGKLRIGDSPIIQLPSGRDQDIVTQGQAALCSGDSGGPLYKQLPTGERRLIGLNSRRNLKAKQSFHSSTSSTQGLDFLKKWAQTNAVTVCGLHSDANGCRGWMPAPPNSFKFDEINASGSVVMKPGKEGLLEKAKSAIVDAVNKL